MSIGGIIKGLTREVDQYDDKVRALDTRKKKSRR